MARSLSSDARAAVARARRAVAGFPGWVGGVLTGLQGAALSLIVVLVPALGVAAATPAVHAGTGIEWGGAAGVAISLWLLAHSAPLTLEAATITVIPWGLTVVAAAILAAVARRFASRSWGSWALAVATYAALVTAVAAVTGQAGPVLVRVAMLAALLSGTAVAIGIWRAHGARFDIWPRLAGFVRTGLHRAAGSLAALVLLAGATATVWTLLGRHSIGGTATALELDWLGGLVFALAQLAWAPTLMAWALAWLTGQGFTVGEGSFYAPDAVVEGALPALPLLGALPGGSGGLLGWVPALIVLAVLVVRAMVSARDMPGLQDLKADAVAWGMVVIATAGIMAAATGAAGPGRLASVGPDVLSVTAMMAVLVLLGLALGTGLQALLALAGQARGEPAPDPDSEEDSATASALRPSDTEWEGAAQGSRSTSPSSTSR